MDKAAERETHDFMNVESFSQLPFIRPQPAAKERPAAGIKLFGIEFGNTDNNNTESNPENLDTTTAMDEPISNKDSDSNADSGRRFECHYCCRNFPTSQALGGHQNAHKRERQHAKRAHLHSAMVHGGLTDPAHVYGYMNYHHRLGSSATYPSWNNSNSTMSTNSTPTHHHNYSTTTTASTTNNRFYGSGHHHHHGTTISSYSSQQPINGSPLAYWRIPPSSVGHHHNNPSSTTSASTATSFNNRDFSSFSPSTHHSLPLFAGGGDDIGLKSSPGGNNLSTTSNSSHGRYVYEAKPSMQDHVSLDLHL